MLTDVGTAVVYRVGTDWKGAGGDLLGDENDLQLDQSVGYTSVHTFLKTH